MWTLLTKDPEQACNRRRHPFQARYTAREHTPDDFPWGVIRSRTPVHRSPCGIAQCLALNLACEAQAEYGNYKQLHPNNRIGAVGQRSRVPDVSRCHLQDLPIVGMNTPKVNYPAVPTRATPKVPRGLPMGVQWGTLGDKGQ